MNKTLWSSLVFAGVLAVLVCLIVKLFQLGDAPAGLVIAIVALAGLLALSPRVFDLMELTISKDGIVAKLDRVERKLQETERKVDRIFAAAMSEPMFLNLKKLASGRFGHFKNGGGLQRELRFLRDVGYISVEGGIGKLPKEGDDLSRFVKITQVGDEFVKLREEMESAEHQERQE